MPKVRQSNPNHKARAGQSRFHFRWVGQCPVWRSVFNRRQQDAIVLHPGNSAVAHELPAVVHPEGRFGSRVRHRRAENALTFGAITSADIQVRMRRCCSIPDWRWDIESGQAKRSPLPARKSYMALTTGVAKRGPRDGTLGTAASELDAMARPAQLQGTGRMESVNGSSS